MKAALLILLAPVFVFGQTQAPALSSSSEVAAVVTTTTVSTTTTTTTTTSTTLPAVRSSVVFTSPLLNKIMSGDAPASNLPYWYGFRWNRKIQAVADEWTEFLYKEIDSVAPALIETSPRDITNFCPHFDKLNRDERILFWVRLITLLMSYESGYKPHLTYDDSKNVGSREPILSSGLLMISHESVMRDIYACTMIDRNKQIGQKDLLDPKKNMACAVRVMNRWIREDGVIADRDENPEGQVVWKGLARYWGPFRHVMLKKDEQGLWGALLKRVPRWQEESNIRDQYLQAAVKTAIQTSGPVLDKRIWEATGSQAPHPSLLEEKYKKEESHSFTGIVRIMNQTGFCYK